MLGMWMVLIGAHAIIGVGVGILVDVDVAVRVGVAFGLFCS